MAQLCGLWQLPAPTTLKFMARTVKSVMSCEPKRASPYSVDLRWCMMLQNNHILRHVEITSMYGNTSTQCCKDSAKPCTVVPVFFLPVRC